MEWVFVTSAFIGGAIGSCCAGVLVVFALIVLGVVAGALGE